MTIFVLMVLIDIASCLPAFLDVSIKAGLDTSKGPLLKYGGPTIADLDGDGFPDMLFGHHTDNATQLYWNQRNGTFALASWHLHLDLHGITAFRTSPESQYMHFALSRGGSRGRSPNLPFIFAIKPQRSIVDITSTSGIDPMAIGRGRSSISLHLDKSNIYLGPSLVFINAKLKKKSNESNNKVFQPFQNTISNQIFQYRLLSEASSFASETNTHATVVDVDRDGFVEIISFHNLRIYSVGTPTYHTHEVTTSVLPRTSPDSWRAVNAVAELDFDNDGMWDLYIARTDAGNLKWRKGRPKYDRLLRNIGGRYVDVSEESGIPSNTQSQGVTVGDFDGDGWTDLVIIRYSQADLLLRNNGDGTFSVHDAGLGRDLKKVKGDMATAVDYDSDGKLDLVVSEGDWFNREGAGFYKMMKNVTPTTFNYLLIRVRNSPQRKSTSLHAVATVGWRKGMVMVRRVGSPGTAVSISYIELLHFGLGDAEAVKWVRVRWVNGEQQIERDVSSNKLLTFGVA